ncbi:hypothetical protein [Clostridium sp. CF012]|uniref:hypothetical protein n=1 Tax=Clostridium sp. CF012 TaxID=2843319 RepID=UPI001C0DCB33|nr:hypothetical protein [Clostridium sp. CF012]MBU3146912.1 hypothetical protein [Clostridium sp. CF012]
MIFNDYVNGLNEQKEELEKLDFIIQDVDKILQLHESWTNSALSKVYLRKIHNSYSSSAAEANNLTDQTAQYIDKLREILICIDFLEYGEILSNFRAVRISGLEEKSTIISDDFKKAYKIIHEYKKLTDSTQRANQYYGFIEALHLMKNTYTNFKFIVDYLNIISLGLNKGIESDIFEIRLLNETFDRNTYGRITDPMYIIYEKLCEIANIGNPLPLKIVRMETGSFLMTFIGEVGILKVLGKFLESTHGLWIRNFTRDGKKQNLVESTELFKEHFNLVSEMRALGLNVDEHDEIAKETLVLLMKQSNILLSSSPDIKINKKVLSKSEDFKKALANKEFISLPVNDGAVS